MPMPMAARMRPRTTASRETRPGCQVPTVSWWMSWTWRRTELRVTMTPRVTRATPDQRERPVVWEGGWDSVALSWRRKRPKRLTAKPIPMRPRPVRIQARKVRSAARYTRGSCSAGLSMEGLYDRAEELVWGLANDPGGHAPLV